MVTIYIGTLCSCFTLLGLISYFHFCQFVDFKKFLYPESVGNVTQDRDETIHLRHIGGVINTDDAGNKLMCEILTYLTSCSN